MALDYFVLVFLAAVGVYQIASIPARLEGLWFFQRKGVQYFFGVLAVIGAFSWFYSDEERNIQHTVEGAQQFVMFLGAIIGAYVATAILASIIQARVGSRGSKPVKGKQHDQGMETLKATTLFGGIISSLRKTREDKD